MAHGQAPDTQSQTNRAKKITDGLVAIWDPSKGQAKRGDVSPQSVECDVRRQNNIATDCRITVSE